MVALTKITHTHKFYCKQSASALFHHTAVCWMRACDGGQTISGWFVGGFGWFVWKKGVGGVRLHGNVMHASDKYKWPTVLTVPLCQCILCEYIHSLTGPYCVPRHVRFVRRMNGFLRAHQFGLSPLYGRWLVCGWLGVSRIGSCRCPPRRVSLVAVSRIGYAFLSSID